MVSYDLEVGDYVRLDRIPNLIFQIREVQEKPPVTWSIFKPWEQRAYIHFTGGADEINWGMLARWEPLKDLIKMNAMEVIAKMAQ